MALKGWADFWKNALTSDLFPLPETSWFVNSDNGHPTYCHCTYICKILLTCCHSVSWETERGEKEKKTKLTTRKACETREKTLQDTGATQEPHLWWHLRAASSGVAIETSHSTRPLRCISFFFEWILVIWFHLNKKCAGSNPPGSNKVKCFAHTSAGWHLCV